MTIAWVRIYGAQVRPVARYTAAERADFIKQSKLAQPGALGWVDVHEHTLQHVRNPNVFSLGDASSLPCAKTGAAVRKQAPV